MQSKDVHRTTGSIRRRWSHFK